MKKAVCKNWADMPELLDIETVSLILGVSSNTVRRLCRTGEIPALKVGKRMWRIAKSKLMEMYA